MTLPNSLTFLRLLLTIAGVAFLMMPGWMMPGSAPQYGAAEAIFLLAVATDFLDGFIARRWKMGSQLGALLDPLVDKLLVYAYFLLLLLQGLYPAWLFLLMFARDLLNDAFRSFLAGKGTVVPANWGGKWKTTLQMLSIVVALTGAVTGVDVRAAALITMIAALVCGVVGTVQFLRGQMRLLRDHA